MKINNKEFGEWTADDLQVLLNNDAYRENNFIDYKVNFAPLVDKCSKREKQAEFRNDVCNTAKNDCNVAALLVFTDFLIKKSGSKCNKTFYHESDRNINEISADQVRKCRSDTACKEAPDRSENYTGEDHDSVPRVNVSAGSRSRDADGHGCHAGKCSKQSCEN